MEGQVQGLGGLCQNFSTLLELAASDDLIGFRHAVEDEGLDVNEASFWYGRRIGSKKMGFELRTPLMIAAMYGSKDVLTYLIRTCRVDLTWPSASDGATTLDLAVAGAASRDPEVIRILLDALGDADSLDVMSSTFGSRTKNLEVTLKGSTGIRESCESSDEKREDQQESITPRATKDGTEKKEYPVDLSLPDIKNGIYGTDEFRMYAFKIKPCSRAYSHDWTECPFVHPGENARRRDPRKYHYSCVPCPEFRKGSCRQGDACEYAHGIFECWLHPAQYRTRLCKDETGCTRRVCFFAHKPEELRPLYASTGSAVPSPKSFFSIANSLEMGSVSPPMTPSGASSPGNIWQNNIASPTLQLPGSRLKSSFNARDIDFDIELLSLENQHHRQHQHQQLQLMDELSGLSSPSSWNNSNRLGGVKPTNLEDIFGSLDHTTLPQSPRGNYMSQNINQQLRSSYPTNLTSSPSRTSPPFGVEQSRPSGASLLSARATAFVKRSQSFIERSAVNRHSGPSSNAAPGTAMLSDWNSPDGKLNWGMQGDELNKLRKSASFGYRSYATAASPIEEPDVSWVQSLVKDVPSGRPGNDLQEQNQYRINTGGSEALPAWVEQFYMEHEQMVA